MWGLCQVRRTWYEGSQTEGVRRWWYDGQNWSDQPVQSGPFNSEAEALQYAKDNQLKSCFVYSENDPFGTGGT